MFELFTSKEVKSVIHEDMALEQVGPAIRALMAQVSINHHKMGLLHNHVVDKELAQKAGYKNAKEWFSQHVAELSYATLRTYGAVAGAFSEEVTWQFGVTSLSLLLTYEEAADMEANHEEPGTTVIEVPGPNGQVLAKTFSQCGVEELRKAIQRKRKPSSGKPLPPGSVERGEQYEAALKARLPRVTTVQVQVRNVKGKAVVDFKGIPLEQVNKLMEVLMGELPPVPEVRLVEKLVPLA